MELVFFDSTLYLDNLNKSDCITFLLIIKVSHIAKPLTVTRHYNEMNQKFIRSKQIQETDPVATRL